MPNKKKRKDGPTVDDLLERAWCYYCEKDFDDLKILIDHQKAKHFRCSHCPRRLNTIGGLSVHVTQVHKDSISEVANALPNRKSVDIEIFGMEGIPEEILQAHRHRVTEEYFKQEAERRAATGNPSRGTQQGQPPVKKQKVETKEEIKARLAEHRAKRKAEKEAAAAAAAAGANGANPTIQDATPTAAPADLAILQATTDATATAAVPNPTDGAQTATNLPQIATDANAAAAMVPGAYGAYNPYSAYPGNSGSPGGLASPYGVPQPQQGYAQYGNGISPPQPQAMYPATGYGQQAYPTAAMGQSPFLPVQTNPSPSTYGMQGPFPQPLHQTSNVWKNESRPKSRDSPPPTTSTLKAAPGLPQRPSWNPPSLSKEDMQMMHNGYQAPQGAVWQQPKNTQATAEDRRDPANWKKPDSADQSAYDRRDPARWAQTEHARAKEEPKCQTNSRFTTVVPSSDDIDDLISSVTGQPRANSAADPTRQKYTVQIPGGPLYEEVTPEADVKIKDEPTKDAFNPALHAPSDHTSQLEVKSEPTEAPQPTVDAPERLATPTTTSKKSKKSKKDRPSRLTYNDNATSPEEKMAGMKRYAFDKLANEKTQFARAEPGEDAGGSSTVTGEIASETIRDPQD